MTTLQLTAARQSFHTICSTLAVLATLLTSGQARANNEIYKKALPSTVWVLAGTLKTAPNLDLTLRMLEQNARTKLGAWMTERSETGEYMLIYCVKLDATASPEAMKSTMEYVAKLTRTAKKDLLPKEASTTPSQTLDAWLTQ